jgi:hypothetical protein
MQWNYEPTHPAAPDPELALANLAMAVLVGLVADLEGANPKHRQQAREAIAAHVPELWLAALDLPEEQEARVLALFCELRHQTTDARVTGVLGLGRPPCRRLGATREPCTPVTPGAPRPAARAGRPYPDWCACSRSAGS